LFDKTRTRPDSASKKRRVGNLGIPIGGRKLEEEAIDTLEYSLKSCGGLPDPPPEQLGFANDVVIVTEIAALTTRLSPQLGSAMGQALGPVVTGSDAEIHIVVLSAASPVGECLHKSFGQSGGAVVWHPSKTGWDSLGGTFIVP
jgi:hypothetical protein